MAIFKAGVTFSKVSFWCPPAVRFRGCKVTDMEMEHGPFGLKSAFPIEHEVHISGRIIATSHDLGPQMVV